MKLRLPNLLPILSLLLCLAVAALWVRSYGGCDVVVRPRGPGDRLCVTSEFGVLVVEWETPPPALVVRPGWEYFQTPLPRRWPVRRAGLGFDAYTATVTHYVRLPPARLHGLTVPHWFAALATATLPAAWHARRRRARVLRRRTDAGLCASCGYDLRATPDRCPECGRIVEAGR